VRGKGAGRGSRVAGGKGWGREEGAAGTAQRATIKLYPNMLFCAPSF